MKNVNPAYAGAMPRGYVGEQAQSGQANAPNEVATCLLESLLGTLNVAHDRVGRLEGLATRIFGEECSDVALAPEPIVVGDALLVTARNLVARLSVVVDRLELLA